MADNGFLEQRFKAQQTVNIDGSRKAVEQDIHNDQCECTTPSCAVSAAGGRTLRSAPENTLMNFCKVDRTNMSLSRSSSPMDHCPLPVNLSREGAVFTDKEIHDASSFEGPKLFQAISISVCP